MICGGLFLHTDADLSLVRTRECNDGSGDINQCLLRFSSSAGGEKPLSNGDNSRIRQQQEAHETTLFIYANTPANNAPPAP